MINNSLKKRKLADGKVRKKLPLGVNLLRTLRGHTEWIIHIEWSPDGRMLMSSSADGTTRLWDAKTGKCLHTLESNKQDPLSFSFDPKGRILIIGSKKKTIELWDPTNGQRFHILKGHSDVIPIMAFDPTGGILAIGHENKAANLWDVTSGKLLYTLEGHSDTISSIRFDPTGRILASGSRDKTAKLWDVTSGKLLYTLEGHSDAISSIRFDPTGRILTSGSYSNRDNMLKLWEVASGKLLQTLVNNRSYTSTAFDPQGRFLAIGDRNRAIQLWETENGKLSRVLEGHTGMVTSVAFAPKIPLLASRSIHPREILLWHTDTFDCLAKINFGKSNTDWVSHDIAFHPHLPYFAAVIWDTSESDKKPSVIHIWELDLPVLLSQVSEPSVHYVNAKVMLVGDTGVGKTGLSLVLNNQPFEATYSTPGRRVWTLDSQEVKIGNNIEQTRETLLWDLAGQPGYRVIHQLHLNEVAVALVVFDARSETDPLAGVRHWERALRLAQQRQGTSSVPMKKFLVSARNDRGGVSISEERLQTILKDFGFDGYFKTSAKEGWSIKELRFAIEQAIAWENLPEVASSQLFADIKSFLLDVKKTGQLLSSVSELYNDFVHQRPDAAEKVTNLRDQFDTCIGRLENRDLTRRLTFGGYILLQPELLDAYASAMVNEAKEEPDGLGSIAEEIALGGKFFVPEEQKVKDSGQEQLLLHATVEELICHDLALRENANDGSYLVFPSQFNRDYEDAPEPKGKALAITFDGPVQSLYSTLVVRLGHSGLFTTTRVEMWRNAALFTSKAGGKCGIFLQEFAEARGRLILFFDEHASKETRFHFEEFVLAHTKLRSLDGSMELLRFFVCSNGHPVPDDYVKILLGQGKKEFPCPCGAVVPLIEPKECILFQSEVEAMDKSANHQRDFDVFVTSARGEISTKSFQKWAGGERVTLAIVFTDIVGSTALGEEIGDESMNKVRQAHFTQSRRLIDFFEGQEIKTIGDSFMAAFKSVGEALDYAMALQKNTGHPRIQIRAGIHIGPMDVEEYDVFGGTVNFAARVVGSIKHAEIWVSDRAKEDIDRLGAVKHKQLCWKQHRVAMKGFSGRFKLWSVQ